MEVGGLRVWMRATITLALLLSSRRMNIQPAMDLVIVAVWVFLTGEFVDQIVW
jgi:hypothetical protein